MCDVWVVFCDNGEWIDVGECEVVGIEDEEKLWDGGE